LPLKNWNIDLLKARSVYRRFHEKPKGCTSASLFLQKIDDVVRFWSYANATWHFWHIVGSLPTCFKAR